MNLRCRLALRAAALCTIVIACGPASVSVTSAPPPSPDIAGPSGPVRSPADPASGTGPAGSPPSPAPTSPTVAQIATLRDRITADPNDAEALRDLGIALLQRVRETADPRLYGQAEAALTKARTLSPKDPLVLVGIGGLQLGRHEFAAALDTAKQALALRSRLRPAKAILVDALVELGRYDEAVTATGELIAMGTDLTTLARVSYVRELHGNLEGALAAMQQAAAAPALAPENTAFATTIAGNLLVLTGKRDEARSAYERALQVVPDYAPALAGLGRLAVGDGDLAAAAGHFERAGAIVPLPEYVIALGEAREAAGDSTGARDSYDLARLETQLFQSNGVDVDLELALFETDHGDLATGLDLARRAYATRRTVRTADALAWVSQRSGDAAEAQRLSTEALRLRSRDPLLLYHAGMIAAAAGDAATARQHLTDALALDPGFSATGAAAARAELAKLGTTS